MSINIDMYRIASRDLLKNQYISSSYQLQICCGVCWCCKKSRLILTEFDKKGFTTFNSKVDCWKVCDHPKSKWEIFPLKH